MKNDPLVSILCTNYNKGKWIEESIKSFLSQKTTFDYEIVIVDDQSTDGSLEIIKKYEKKYPGKIRVFSNKNNLGITKTWINSCKQARGKYIARCDGDDYWTSVDKLQHQVDVLEKSEDSKWSNTDYDTVLPDGEIVSRSAFETGLTTKVESYEEALAIKGFTAPSSWVVETELMLEINNDIDSDAVDDTFNIELELFRRTKLSYLQSSTLAYRIGYDSDSNPTDSDKAKKRGEKLLDTQVEYIKKYNDADYAKALEAALKESVKVSSILVSCKDELSASNQTVKEQAEIIETQKNAIETQESIIETQREEIADVFNSRRYKLGEFLTSPMSFFKSRRNKK